MKKGALSLILFLITVLSVAAGEWLLGDSGSSVFLPVGWDLFSAEEAGRISFIDPQGSIIFQVSIYPGDSYGSDKEMADDHISSLTVLEEESSRFLYQGRACTVADLSIDSEGVPIRGWFMFLDREDYDYYLTAITGVDNYDKALPLMLSCLDGFSPDEQGRMNGGAVSSLIFSGEEQARSRTLDFAGEDLIYRWEEGREEANRLLIEREAFILSTYGEEMFDEAWKRYYQLIYRNSASDLKELAELLQKTMEGANDIEKAEKLLSWLQGFEYGSTERFSDLMTSTESLIAATGDCDSLALIYITLLNHMNIPAVLMVSREFSHALAAVSVSVEGARFPFGEKSYVVAEMTKKVVLGQISEDMADLNKWLIIPFDSYTQGVLHPGE